MKLMFDEENLTNEMSKLNIDVKKLPLGKLSKKQVILNCYENVTAKDNERI